jgi:hypothetical protein
MQDRRAHLLASSRHATAHVVGTSTRAASAGGTVDATRRGMAGGSDMFGDVEPAIRLQMELVARCSASPETALPKVIELLVPGDPAKRAAIVSAISTNDPLREQWERTWEVLRR